MTGIAADLPPVPDTRPNIVVIYTDDVGYGDLSCYGAARVRTANIDRMAKEGIRFTDAHSPSAVCTPSRLSLLTGMYAWRNQTGTHVVDGDSPICIPPGMATLPSVLKGGGHATGVIGKWHLGLTDAVPDYNKPLRPGPNERGFHYSFIYPATNDRVPCVYIENGSVVGYDPSDPIDFSYKKKVGTDPTGRENPDQIRLQLVAGHDGTIVNGVSRIGHMSGGRKARWNDETMTDVWFEKASAFIGDHRDGPFFLYLAPHQVHVPQLPNPKFVGKSGCGIRGDTLLELDDFVGRILNVLERNGLDDNTLVIFTSDNGGAMEDGYRDPREDHKDHDCNRPLRDQKYSLYEGGHRVPMVARWPKGIQAGQTSDALFSHVDLMATLASVAGVVLPKDGASDSLDLTQTLTGAKAVGRTQLVYHRGGGPAATALREGPWVLIPRQNGRHELYNLTDDLSQTKNLAEERPLTVKRMIEALQNIRDGSGTRF